MSECLVTLQSMAVVLAVTQLFALGASTPQPEDWVSGPPYHSQPDDAFISAYINITREVESGWVWDRADAGRYGGGYVGPASGAVIHVSSAHDPSDHTGCQLPFRSTRPDKSLPPPGEPWIALIKRGNCNFEVKVDNAYKSNAAGVLVYNDRESNSLDKMKISSDNGRNISAIFIYKSKGEELARLSENNSNVFVHITIAGHTPSRNVSLNRTSVLFVSITFVVLMVISISWLVFYYVQRFRYIHAKDRLSKRLCNAAKKALSKIPTKNIKNGDKEVQGDGECCAICLEPYKLSEVLRILPCSHEFHKSCIDPWLLDHRTCPMCKMDILKHYGFGYFGSEESILHMEIEEDGGIDSTDESQSPRRGSGISPLPQIRTVIVSDHQRSYGSSTDGEDQSSRASTPNEMTPSLPSTTRQIPVHQDLCVSCIAAAAAMHNSDSKLARSSSDEQSDSSSRQMLSSSRDAARAQSEASK